MCSYNVLHFCNVGIDSLHFWLSGALWVWAKSICYFPSLNTQTHLLTHIRKASYKRSPSWTDTCTCTHSLQLQFVPICSRRWGGGQSDMDGWTAAWTESKDNKWREGRNELTVKCIHYSYRNKCLVRNWWHHHQSASHALLFPSHRWALAAPCISLRCSYICSNFVAFIFIVYVIVLCQSPSSCYSWDSQPDRVPCFKCRVVFPFALTTLLAHCSSYYSWPG